MFEVGNALLLEVDAPILEYLPEDSYGTELMYLNVIVGNHEYVIYHYDFDTLEDLLHELANWA